MTINKDVADRLQLPAFGKVLAGGAAAHARWRFREAPHFELGPLVINGPVTMLELPTPFTKQMESMQGFEFAGTVSADSMAHVVAELGLTTPTLDFRNPVRYELKQGTWQTLRFNRKLPCVLCKVDDQHEGWFQFDTGAGNAIHIHTPAVEQFHLLEGRTTESQSLQGVGGAIDAELGTLGVIHGRRAPPKRCAYVFYYWQRRRADRSVRDGHFRSRDSWRRKGRV